MLRALLFTELYLFRQNQSSLSYVVFTCSVRSSAVHWTEQGSGMPQSPDTAKAIPCKFTVAIYKICTLA